MLGELQRAVVQSIVEPRGYAPGGEFSSEPSLPTGPP